MNNNYYTNPLFPENNLNITNPNLPKEPVVSNLNRTMTTTKISLLENILHLNHGKKAKFHVTVPGSNEHQDKIFEGIIEETGPDHIIVSNPSGEWYLIPLIYLDFATFEEPINFI